VVTKAPRRKIRRVASTVRRQDTLLLIVLIFRKKKKGITGKVDGKSTGHEINYKYY